MKRFAALVPLAILLVATAPARPASLDIAADCGATPDDGLDDTLAIRACLALEPRELVFPIGVFNVAKTSAENATLAALDVKTSDTVVRGDGPGSVIRLVRDENGFSSDRIFRVFASTVDVERVVFRDFTIDGARDARTCLETKHTPGLPPDGKGQQQHGILVSGQGAAVRDVVIERVSFKGISGDAIYLYQGIEDFRLAGQTVSGYCRAGIAMNAYADPARPDEGMRRILVDKNTFIADPTATQGARAVDVEPNTHIYDITITNNTLDDIEAGRVVRLRVEGNTIGPVGAQLGGQIIVVSAEDFSIANNSIASEDALTSAVHLNKSGPGTIANNAISTLYPISGINITNHGTVPSSDLVVSGNRIAYTGAGVAATYAIRTQGVDGTLTISGNTTVGAWDYGFHIYGGDDVLVADNVLSVAKTGLVVRSNPGGVLETGAVEVRGNRGSAQTLYSFSNAVTALRDCGNSASGTRALGPNVAIACTSGEAVNAAAIGDLRTRVEVLEAQ